MVSTQGSGKWFELQDLHTVDILPQMITLSESYIQVSEYIAGLSESYIQVSEYIAGTLWIFYLR